jgi:hypothetical protein
MIIYIYTNQNSFLTVNIPFIPTRLRLNEATISVSDEDRPGINSLKLKILF